MPGPNPEQLKAIEHQGGALLSAGAGSGKTFVLAEHLIYLAKRWLSEFSPETDPDFGQYIKSKLSKVVLMTFTKKAAGEIGIRIRDNFHKAKKDDPERAKLWEKTIENLDSLTISTIHGYCYKLIKQGFFADINPSDEIIGEGEFSKAIEDIFTRILDRYEASGLRDEFTELVYKEKKSIFQALKNIISDPTLRLMWKKMDTRSYTFARTDEAMEELLLGQNFGELFEREGDLSFASDFSDKDWFKYLERSLGFAQKKDFSLKSVTSFGQELADADFKIPRKPSAKAVPEEAKTLYEDAKALKDFIKGAFDDLTRFEDEGIEIVRNWYGRFKDLFEEVEMAYASSPGFTFGDLEYIVNQKLQDPGIAQMVAREYEYIIVDEFQDTSFVQFSIIEKIVGSNFHKVFCVGDVKQAIYGFRGGELGVFLEMEQKAPLNLKLKNNYRSDKSVINFNNALFDHVFKLGLGFEGKDHYAVEVVRQTAPIEERPDGEIFEINADASFLEGELEKLSNSDVEYLEALALLEEIKKQDMKTAILYRKLKPAKILMQLLLDEGLGFTSQVKVPMLEDPVLGIFYSLVKNLFDKGALKDEYLLYSLRSYYKILGFGAPENMAQLASEFQQNMKYYGVYQAFILFLSSTGLAISTYKQNLENARLLIDLCAGDLSKISSRLDDWSDLSYSIDFQYGENPGSIVIMSAHASKGLEFPRVLLGGIYTNDANLPNTDMFGKTPFSFKWSEQFGGKKKYKSPHYMLEALRQKRKEFSESKRLFYVACTRAEKSLGWARIQFGALKTPTIKGSWIYGIDNFFSHSEEGQKFKENMAETSRDVNISKKFSLGFLGLVSNQPPMFHYDNLGIEQKNELLPSFLLPELSVTRLAQVSLCPRKFYLKNVLKLESENAKAAPEKSSELELTENQEDLSSRSFSSAERGTQVHDELSKVILGELDPQASNFSAQINWVVEKLKTYGENANFISEKPIKFEVFQYMVSGIPDLIISYNHGESQEIWDFKTGSSRRGVPENYWFQLYAYALSGFNSGAQNLIKLVLCYVDDQEVVERNVSKKDVENYLWSHCLNLGRPDQVQVDHCPSCEFNQICKGKSLSPCAPSFS